MKIGDRVTTRQGFLSDGVIEQVVRGIGYLVKLDEKAPDHFAIDAEVVLLFPCDVELVK